VIGVTDPDRDRAVDRHLVDRPAVDERAVRALVGEHPAGLLHGQHRVPARRPRVHHEHLGVRVPADHHLLPGLEPQLGTVRQHLHEQVGLWSGHPRTPSGLPGGHARTGPARTIVSPAGPWPVAWHA
jgi:hypothetical protein